MFDLVAGFVHTQCLAALVEFRTLDILLEAPQSAHRLAAAAKVPFERMSVLLDAGISLGLLRTDGRDYRLTLRGAALTGVPGLSDMIRHHGVLYRDLADPAAFFRGEIAPELADFWPYVFGAGASQDPAKAERYSILMHETQSLVADETLAAVNLSGHRRLLDVGGGTGAFLLSALTANPKLEGVLFDLPQVTAGASRIISRSGLAERVSIVAGSFRDEPLPEGADAISLVRVLYDHADDTVATLLARAFRALPAGGTLLVSEPMTGGSRPSRSGNAYFAIYTMAMRTGRTRSPARIAKALYDAGFEAIRHRPTNRPFVTSVVTARKPRPKVSKRIDT